MNLEKVLARSVTKPRCHILGFQVTQRMGDSAAFLSAGGYHQHLGLNTWHSKDAPPAPERAAGLYHVAILYPTWPNLMLAKTPSPLTSASAKTPPDSPSNPTPSPRSAPDH